METSELYTIKEMVDSCLGTPKRESNIDGWFEYNCPNCADINGHPDNKHNLAVSFNYGYCHCWKCGTAMLIGGIIKHYGSASLYDDYRAFLREVTASLSFQLTKFNDEHKNYLTEVQNDLTLPSNTRDIMYGTKAYDYLAKRGITDEIISKYRIKVGIWGDEYMFRNRIIVPSYNQYGDLNYFVARDFTGKQNLKYTNPSIPKTSIIFNEGMVNWYDTIYLCEGVFDSIVIPNSIPMLGKSLDSETVLYQSLLEKAQSDVVVFLDDDAWDDAKDLYMRLNTTNLNGRVKVIPTPEGYDPSLIHQEMGVAGMVNVLRTAKKI